MTDLGGWHIQVLTEGVKDIFTEVNESQKEGVEGKKWVNVCRSPNNHGLLKTTLGVVIKIIMTNLESIKIIPYSSHILSLSGIFSSTSFICFLNRSLLFSHHSYFCCLTQS